jgi:hypothetical protein
MEDAYEAVGLHDTGDIFTVEILGRQPETVAVHTAQMWAASGNRPSTSIAFPSSTSGRQRGSTIRWKWFSNSCRRAPKADGPVPWRATASSGRV